MTPWDTVNIDSSGPQAFIDHTGKERVLNTLTIIDPSTGLFETCRCPKPHKVTCNQGYEFKLEFKELCETCDDIGVPSSLRDPKRNAIVERTHLALLNMLRSLELSDAMWED